MKSNVLVSIVMVLVTGMVAYGVHWTLGGSSPESALERRLKNPELIPKISWNMLYKYDYQNNTGPDDLMALDGQLVQLPGYIVPLSDSWTVLDEFLVVPDAQACIHVPPPPPNLIVSVKLRESVPMEEVYNPSWVIGIFRIEESYSVHGGSSYTLDGVQLKKFEFEGY